ncbi:hypothetical protein ABZP36_020207 [Zizania latifolia]
MTSSSSPSRKVLSKIACNRLQKELAEWQVSPPSGFKHKVTDNLQSSLFCSNSLVGHQSAIMITEYLTMELGGIMEGVHCGEVGGGVVARDEWTTSRRR